MIRRILSCRLVAALAVAVCAFAPVQAIAQSFGNWPERPIRLIVPFPAGDGLDMQARMIGQHLSQRLGQQVIVDNRPGAGTLIGVGAAVEAPADGYTIVLVTTTFAINPALREKVPYDPVKDFTPLIQTTAIPLVVVGSPKFAPDNFAEVLALARQKPGTLTIGNSGIGTAAHIGMELLDSLAGVKFVHVPYKGIPPAFTDLVSGDLNMLCTSPAQVMPAIRDGKIKALGVTGGQRMSQLPDVATVEESGVKGYEVNAWVGLMMRRGTPDAVIERLNTEIAAILALPDVRDRLTTDGSRIVASRPADFSRHVEIELAKWSKVIREAGIKPQ